MHTFIYPSQDTYINNSSKFKDRNFGIDEILEIYASNDGKKTVYTSPYWHDVPLTSSSYGNEGWLAYTTSSIFIYSGSKWRKFDLTSSNIPGTSFIANFTGRLKNKTDNPKIALYLSGSADYASGSFSGSVTSPYCVTSSYSGSFISSSGWGGIISTVTSSNLNYVDVVNFVGYFKGVYTGSFTVPSTANYLITPEFSRTLLKFDLTSLSQSISNNTISGSNIKFSLNLKCCGARNIPLNYTIYAYPLNQSWDNGNGRYADDGSQLGCSWDYRNYDGSGIWYGTSTTGSIYKQDNYLLSASYSASSWINQGGTWYYNVPASYTNKPKWFCSSSKYTPLANASLICSQSFSYGEQSDISMDITQIVRSWLCGCVPNNGLILLTSLEISTPPLQNTNGLLQFFSRDTNTIYSPYIDVKWDDSVFNTGSLAPVTGSTQNLINIQYLKNEYKAGSLPKIFVFARDRYPLKSFNKAYQQPVMITPKYLPSNSYYMIKDAESEEVIVGFDEYTKLSCDPIQGNYFKLQTTGLPQERYMKIFIKSEYDDGVIDIVDTGKVFKIVR
jgi:hypothetical protein